MGWTVLDSLGFQIGGWGEIRTHEPLARPPVFKTGAFNRSATHPGYDSGVDNAVQG